MNIYMYQCVEKTLVPVDSKLIMSRISPRALQYQLTCFPTWSELVSIKSGFKITIRGIIPQIFKIFSCDPPYFL